MNRTSGWWLLSLALQVASAASAWPAGAQSGREDEPTEATSLATWVWRHQVIEQPRSRRELLRFVESRGVKTLYVHLSERARRRPAASGFGDLLAEARALGVAVAPTGGDPAWTRRHNHHHALAFVSRVRSINSRLEQDGVHPIQRVLFDVEPYLLPGWRTQRKAVLAQYVALLDELYDAARTAQVEIWHTIPFWFSSKHVQGQPLDRAVLERSDGVVVMAYRRQARRSAAAALETLARAEALQRSVVVAVETKCVDPPQVSFCRSSAAALGSALRYLHSRLRRYSAFAGLAVHQYESWRELERRHP